MSVPEDVRAAVDGLMARTEVRRRCAVSGLDAEQRRYLGQFFTPRPVAERIAGETRTGHPAVISVLDPGAGVGSLTAAFVARVVLERSARRVEVTAVEIDTRLAPELRATLDDCVAVAARSGIEVSYSIESGDFVRWGSDRLGGTLDAVDGVPRFDVVILNPPYRKLGRGSLERRRLDAVHLDAPNLYAAFLALGAGLLAPDGQLVAITPRSFANGAYFRTFRRNLFDAVSVLRICTFLDRGSLFADASVLQENIILTVRRGDHRGKVTIVTSRGHTDRPVERVTAYEEILRPDDREMFLHIPTDTADDTAASLIESLPARLSDLRVEVSTGRVVDFRASEHLRPVPQAGAAPLIYPTHLRNGRVCWPAVGSRKPNALADNDRTRRLMLPAGTYVLVKRFSAKEEARRVVAAVFRAEDAPGDWIGFENHLNVFHEAGSGLDEETASGLAAWLNSTVFDLHFRRFSGHTQVNATDLRNLRYPARSDLVRLGRAVAGRGHIDQHDLDEIIKRYISDKYNAENGDDSVPEESDGKLALARKLLRDLNFDSERSNERSALVLLALLNLPPDTPWSDATCPTLRTFEIMEFIRLHYGRDYKPNTRETIRRQTLHQFASVALVLQNPDVPDRPINSPKWCYQISPAALEVCRSYGSDGYDELLRKYLVDVPSLVDMYAAERQAHRIPVTLPDGSEIRLSPGGQNELLRLVIDEFCSRFTPGGQVLYIGDADEKWMHFDQHAFAQLGIQLDEHGKMPDLVVYLADRDWLVLLEAASNHGPVDAKRHGELRNLFAAKADRLVFVSCFPTRAEMRRYLSVIAWESEAWCADEPSHIMHFNGDRFLGPYPTR